MVKGGVKFSINQKPENKDQILRIGRMLSNQVVSVFHILSCFLASESIMQIVSGQSVYRGRTKSILDILALRMHVGLADRKWVHVCVFEVTETMVDEAVCSFVRAHGIQNIPDGRICVKTPIVFGDRRRIQTLPSLG